MGNKKGIIIGIVIALLAILIGGIIGTKLYFLYKYNIASISDEEYFEFQEDLKITDTMTIKTTTLDESEYLVFNDIKIRNDFSIFEILEAVENESNQYILKENGETKASFWFGGTMESLVQLLSSEFELFGFEDEHINLTVEERVQFFKDNNIEDDVDLIEFLSNYDYKKNNLFTSVDKMKENYFVKFITSFLISLGDSITVLDGDLEGYIIGSGEFFKEAYIFKNNKKYVITFIKTDYFTNEYINDLLNTVIITEK